MSYTVEVYRGNHPAEKHLGIYALYVMFYPQLMAGPIERPQNLLYQFKENHDFNYENAESGLRQIMWGLFKKTVIADRLAILVDPIYSHPQSSSGTSLVVATILFSFQIYCDFSGYSDIALGTARVMGFHLMKNFNKPYSAVNISEFWKRWHISLSTWLRDYVFNPIALSLRERGVWGFVFAAMATFLISGFWHGAAWKFIVFGALIGLGNGYEILTRKTRKKLFKKMPVWLSPWVGRFFTYSYTIFICIFFRSNDLVDAIYIVKKSANIFPELLKFIKNRNILRAELFPQTDLHALVICFLLIAFLEIMHVLEGNGDMHTLIGKQKSIVRYAIYTAIFFSIYLFGIFDSRSFIYFQF